jgi:hypothetical protein
MKSGSNPKPGSPLAHLKLRPERSEGTVCCIICNLSEGLKLEAWWCIQADSLNWLSTCIHIEPALTTDN